MSEQREYQERRDVRGSHCLKEDPREDNIPLHRWLRESFSRQKVHLSSDVIHSWERDVRCDQIGQVYG